MAPDTPTVAADDFDLALQALVGQPLGPAAVARDPVNQAMIRHWCDAMGDTNPVYTDPDVAGRSVHGGIVAPPTMLQAWNMVGLRRRPVTGGAQEELMRLLDEGGFTSVVATNCDQVYHRYLRPGDLLTEEASLEAVSSLKRTALGEGYFVDTVRRYVAQDGEVVGEMRFRILKFRPAPRPDAASADAAAQPVSGEPEIPWPHPAANRDTAFFWEGTRRHELRIERCSACATLRHPPSPSCAACGSDARDFVVAKGTGTVYSYVVHHHPPVPPLPLPFVVVLVELDEGTRIVGNLLGTDPAAVHVGMAVEVTYVEIDEELVLPQWRAAQGGGSDA